MHCRTVSSGLIAWSFAVVLSASGCGGNHDSANRTADANATGQPAAAGADRVGTPGATTGAAANPNGTAADAKARDTQPPVTVTGCLQKGDGVLKSDYILTEVNTARAAVGTSGTAPSGANGDAVARDQLRQAARAYRLSGDGDALEPLVGKQVRVSGTLVKRSEVNEHKPDGTLKDRDRTKIDAGDLARIDVAQVDSVADACGGKAGKNGSKR